MKESVLREKDIGKQIELGYAPNYPKVNDRVNDGERMNKLEFQMNLAFSDNLGFDL